MFHKVKTEGIEESHLKHLSQTTTIIKLNINYHHVALSKTKPSNALLDMCVFAGNSM